MFSHVHLPRLPPARIFVTRLSRGEPPVVASVRQTWCVYTVLLYIDELGEWPTFVHDGDPMLLEPGVRFRYVDRVESREQAQAMTVRLHTERAARRRLDPRVRPG